ncbi:MAG: phosphoglycolate phosphatase [Thermofilaceae archaeon]|nr:phosphoglycolate phosphatase [Thermofilaceae archaeon]
MPLKCLAVDLDGTLTDSEGVIHYEVVKKLEEIKNFGVKVILVSGASYPAVVTLAYYLPVTRLAVAENGGVVGFRNNYRLLAPAEDRDAILKVIKEKLDGILLYSWQNQFRFVDLAFHPAPGLTPEQATSRASEVLSPIGYEVVDSGWAIHVHRVGVNKARGLLEACKILDLDPSSVAAVGDSEVDIPMFEVAGVSVALGNAPTRVKEKACYVVNNSYFKGFLEAVDLLERKQLL